MNPLWSGSALRAVVKLDASCRGRVFNHCSKLCGGTNDNYTKNKLSGPQALYNGDRSTSNSRLPMPVQIVGSLLHWAQRNQPPSNALGFSHGALRTSATVEPTTARCALTSTCDSAGAIVHISTLVLPCRGATSRLLRQF